MNDFTQVGLQILAFASAVGVVARAHQAWRWNLGGILQHLLLGAVAGVGLLGYAPEPAVFVGWGMFLAFDLWPPVLIRRLNTQLGLLELPLAREEAARLRLLVWGAPGRFWSDSVQAVELAADGQAEDAQALMLPYMQPPTPTPFRVAAAARLQAIRVQMSDWQTLIDDYEAVFGDNTGPLPPGMPDAVIRAYLEQGRVAEAGAVLARDEDRAGRRTARDVRLLAVAFYALSGAELELNRALAALDLPGYAAMAWAVRCRVAQGRLAEAQALMAQTLAAVPADQPATLARLQAQLETMPHLPAPGLVPETAEEVAAARAIFETRLRATQLVAPARSAWATITFSVLIALAFIPAHLYTVVPGDPGMIGLADLIRERGGLTQAALHGEPWRLLSYMLLHADGFHVASNLAVLWIFGRQAEGLFGGWRMAVAFLASGVLGAVAQLYMQPEAVAIGASGAALGVFGLVMAGIWRQREGLSAAVRRDRFLRLVFVAVLQLMLDQIYADKIAVWVHAGGLLAGGLLGLVFKMKQREGI